MAEAFIYDHVRTPARARQAGRLAARGDGAGARRAGAARRSASATASTRSWSTTSCSAASIRSARRAATSRARRRSRPDYGNGVPGMQINRFCASGLDAVNFAAAQVMSGQQDLAVGGRRRIDEPRRHRRVGRRLAGRSRRSPSRSYFMPQGVSADLIATKYGFSPRRRRRLRGREPEARRGGLGRRALRQLGRAGARRQRPHDPRPRRAYAARDRHAVARRAQGRPSCMMGEMGGFDAVGHPGASRGRARRTMSTMPAIRPASSTARRPCCSAIAGGAARRRG